MTTPITDPTNRTPREIDERLQALYLAEMNARSALRSAIDTLHHMLGERTIYVGRSRRATWSTTTDQCIAAVEAKIAAGETTGSMYSWRPFSLDDYNAAVNTLATITAEQEVLELEYIRRGRWTRFFTVQANGGHVHSSMNCQTCNNGAEPTSFGWTPELSGLSEAEAVARLGRYASSLCTVCYPSAPVEWTNGSANARTYCPGSGQPYATDTRRHGYARCTGCDEYQSVNRDGTIRKHAPAKGTT